jgi:signal peptidase I
MILRWLFSKTLREACAYRKHVLRWLNAQRDLLSPQAIAGVQIKINELEAAIAEEANAGKIRIKAEELQFAAEKWLKPYPHAIWRENVEVLLVALAVAMAIRTFFVQPFKIPTGSMQPTLYGVMSAPDFGRAMAEVKNFSERKDFMDSRTKSEVAKKIQADIDAQSKLQKAVTIPTGWQRVKDWVHGISYIHVVAQSDGVIKQISPMRKFLIFNIKQSLWIGNANDASPGVEHTIWFPPDYGESDLPSRAGLFPGQIYHKGDDVVKLEVRAGDHLFVDRLTYNFQKPKRGEIIVFETRGIDGLPQDEFYIKRLVVLPGERVQIGNDRHLVINGGRLDAGTPHFERVYGFDPNKPPRESEFSGHVNGTVAQEYNLYPNLAPLFPDDVTVFTNAADSYMVMGDNTCNSSDSRTWGSFPSKNVIGKSWFVYWPITGRFGWGNQ